MKKALIAVSAMALASCQTTNDPFTGSPQRNNTLGGAALGALAGAAGGLLIAGGKDERNAALIGAGVGALVGGGIGYYMDNQEKELRQKLINSGVSVTRAGNDIILNLPENITFKTDDASINSAFYSVLNSVSLILNKYPKTLLDIDGYTDSTGSVQYNQALSERRALSVANYLTAQGVDQRRLRVAGFGKSNPIANNNSPAGRAQNRRVEIRVKPLLQS